MNDNDLLPILNEVLGTKHADVKEFRMDALRRAYLILRINVLLKENPGIQLFKCRPTDEPQTSQEKFHQLAPGALFYRVGETSTMEKMHPAEVTQALFCPYRNCPPDEAKFNAKTNDDRFHICPDTPVVEVPF